MTPEAPPKRDSLRPCPFCGGEAGTHHYEGGRRRPDQWGAECWGDCEAHTPRYDSEAEAVAAWNRRAEAPDPSPPLSEWAAGHLAHLREMVAADGDRLSLRDEDAITWAIGAVEAMVGPPDLPPAPVPIRWLVDDDPGFRVYAQYYGQHAGSAPYAITSDFDNCLSRDGEWEPKPFPSDRTAAFLARCRFATLAEAVAAYRAWREERDTTPTEGRTP